MPNQAPTSVIGIKTNGRVTGFEMSINYGSVRNITFLIFVTFD